MPEDRMGTGISPNLSIAENLMLKSYRGKTMRSGLVLSNRKANANAREMIKRFDVRAPGPRTLVRQLSGGNIQKVLLARELSSEPRVLVAASPTRGLDVGATQYVRRVLVRDCAARRRSPHGERGSRRDLRALGPHRRLLQRQGRRDRLGRRCEPTTDRPDDGRSGMTGPLRIERRLDTPKWLKVAVPLASILLAAIIVGILLAATGHNPFSTYHQMYSASVTADGALTSTFVYATPMLFTGLCAGFRLQDADLEHRR